MTIDQLKNNIGSHAQKLDNDVAQLLAATDPANLDIKALNAHAKAITQDVLKLAGMARSAAAIGGTNDADVVSGAKQVSAAITRLLDATQKVSLNPHDPKTRAQLDAANREVKEAMIYLRSAKAGLLSDRAAEELTYACAAEVCLDVGGIGSVAMSALKTIKDGAKMRDINNLVKSLAAAEKAFNQTAKTLSPAVMDPEARTALLAATNDLANLTNQLVSMVQTSGASPEFVQSINAAAAHMNQSIQRMVAAMDTAESRSGADLDFSTPHHNALSALAALRDSASDPQRVVEAIRNTMANTQELVNYAKKVALTTDIAGKERLDNTINNINDAMTKLIAAAKEVAVRPDDLAAQARLAECAQRLEQCLQEVVTDAGASAATAALRYRAKEAATKSYQIHRNLEDVIRVIPDPNIQAQLGQQVAVSNASIGELLEALQVAAREPQNGDAQVRLLQSSQRALIPISQVVAATKRVAPGIADANQKQALNNAANGLADQLQKLMGSIKGVSEIGGQQEIEEALEQFDATNADLDAAEFAAQGGFLTALPGQTRDDGLALLDLNVKSLNDEVEDVSAIARDPKGRKLGEAAKKLANSAAQVAAAVKTVASTTKDKQMQKNCLAQAKKFNRDVAAVISAARALSAKREDTRLAASLTNAQTALKGGLASLTSAAKGLDSREADEAMDVINKLAGERLVSITPSGDASHFKSAADAMINSSKAMNASLVQLASVARANPRALGAAARMVSSTCAQFIQDAANAAANAANQDAADGLIKNAQELIEKTNNVINMAKGAAVNKDAETQNALNNALTDLGRAIESMQTRGSHPEADKAINRIMELGSVFDQQIQVAPMTPQQILETLEESTQSLATTVAALVNAARMGSAKLGIFAKEATAVVEAIVAASLAASNPVTDTSTATGATVLSPAGQAVIQSVDEILQAPTDHNLVVAAAKALAVNASKLIGNAKTSASKLSDRDDQQNLLKLAHALASATSKVARSAGQQPKTPENIQQLLEAAQELRQKTMELENITNSSGNPALTVDPSVAHALAASARTSLFAVGGAIRASVALVSDQTSDELSASLSTASKSVTDAIVDLMKISQSFNPGKVQLDQTAEALQQAMAELDSAAIQLAAGRIDSPVAYTKPHHEWQEELVNVSRDLAGGISTLLDATRQDASSLKAAGEGVKKSVPVLVQAAKAATATTADPNLQRDLLTLSKDLANAMLGLVRATKDATASNRNSQTVLVDKSKNASQAIGRLVSVLKATVVIQKEIDEAVANIQRVAVTIDHPPQAAPSKDYGELKDNINQAVLAIAEKATTINSAERNNVGQIAIQSKELADMLPNLILKIRDAIASTPEPNAKREIALTAKQLAFAAAALIDSAKRAGDPSAEPAIAQAYAATSKAAADILKSVKKGAVAESAIDNAVELMKNATSTLNSNIIFAQASQLEASPAAATISVGAAQQHLGNATKAVHQYAAALAEAAKGNQLQYAHAAAMLSNTIKLLADAAIMAASKTADNVGQQNILTAAKALAIAAQQVTLSGREAQRKPSEASLSSLGSALESVSGGIQQLAETAAAASADAARAEQQYDNAKGELSTIVLGGDNDQSATPQDLVANAKSLTKSVSELVYAQNQESAATALQEAVGAIRRTFAGARGAATRLTQDPNVRTGLLGAANKIGQALSELFEAAKLDRNDDNAVVRLEQCSATVTSALAEFMSYVNKLPGAANMSVAELSGNMGSLADQEMEKTARLILDAVKQLDAARGQVQNRRAPQNANQHDLEKLIKQGEVAQEVLGAAKEIAEATGLLVNAAFTCQRERKSSPQGARYRADPTWNNGLISAAKAVSAAVTIMVKVSNAVLSGKMEEEALIVAAREIAASTARLVTASKVRGGAATPAQGQLSAAAKSVTTTTSKFLSAAKKAGEQEEANALEEGLSEHGGKIKEFEEQMRILRLEKELMNARKNLGNVRKNQYQQQ
jgi:talin